MTQTSDTLGASIIGYPYISPSSSPIPSSTTWNITTDNNNNSTSNNNSTILQYIRLDIINIKYNIILEGIVYFPPSTPSSSSTATVASSTTCYLGQYFDKPTASVNPLNQQGICYNYPCYPNITSNYIIINQNLIFIYMINVQSIYCSNSTLTPPAGNNILVSIIGYNYEETLLLNQIPKNKIKYLLHFGSEFSTMTYKQNSTILYFTSNDGAIVYKYNYITGILNIQPYASIMSYSPMYTYGLCQGHIQSTFLDTSYSSDFSFTCLTPNGYYYQSPSQWYNSDPTCINMSPEELWSQCNILNITYNALVSTTCEASFNKLCSTSSKNNPPYSCTKDIPADILQAISSSFASSQLVFTILSLLIVFSLRFYYRTSHFYVHNYLPTDHHHHHHQHHIYASNADCDDGDDGDKGDDDGEGGGQEGDGNEYKDKNRNRYDEQHAATDVGVGAGGRSSPLRSSLVAVCPEDSEKTQGDDVNTGMLVTSGIIRCILLVRLIIISICTYNIYILFVRYALDIHTKYNMLHIHTVIIPTYSNNTILLYTLYTHLRFARSATK